MEQANVEECQASTAAVLKVQQPKNADSLQSKKQIQTTESTDKSNDSPKIKTLKRMTSNTVTLLNECIEVYNVQGISIFKLSPQLRLHQAIDYKVPSFDVKVKLDDIKEDRYLWDTLVGYTKRELFIFNGFIYSLQNKTNYLIVDSVWRLDCLFQVYYDLDDLRFRFVFKEDKNTKNRDFRTKLRQPILQKLKEELLKMGLSLVRV